MRSNERAERTYQQALIQDKDKRHPQHDVLVNLLSKPKNLVRVIDSVLASERMKYFGNDNKFHKEDSFVDIQVESRWKLSTPEISKPIGRRKDSWGSPLHYIAGFLDVYAEAKFVVPRPVMVPYSAWPTEKLIVNAYEELVQINSTYYLYDKESLLIYGPPYIENYSEDAGKMKKECVEYDWNYLGNKFSDTYRMAFEVKIEIPSAADVIQQIKFYKEFVERDIIFIVVSPDTRCKDIIESQGIYFYEPYADVN